MSLLIAIYGFVLVKRKSKFVGLPYGLFAFGTLIISTIYGALCLLIFPIQDIN
jgi:hypothetical protein